MVTWPPRAHSHYGPLPVCRVESRQRKLQQVEARLGEADDVIARGSCVSPLRTGPFGVRDDQLRPPSARPRYSAPWPLAHLDAEFRAHFSVAPSRSGPGCAPRGRAFRRLLPRRVRARAPLRGLLRFGNRAAADLRPFRPLVSAPCFQGVLLVRFGRFSSRRRCRRDVHELACFQRNRACLAHRSRVTLKTGGRAS